MLNQKENLRALSRMPQNPSEDSLFVEAIKQTVGVIDKIRSAFRIFFESYRDGVPPNRPPTELSEEQRQLVDAISIFEAPRFQNFSDTMIIHQSVLDRKKKPSPRPIYTFFGACTSVILASLASRVAVRGAIDIGVGSECWEGEIYGPVLASAHHLESEIAQFPRIVLGEELVAYLRSFLEPRNDNLLCDWNRIIAEVCLGMIAVDREGTSYLDYLGKGVRHAYSTSVAGIEADIKNALIFVTAEHERFIEAENEKLALRYGDLRAYWESRSKLWGKA